MPIPRPKPNESQDDFVYRCHSTLSNEYPDQKQRHAICMDSWRESKSKSLNPNKIQKTLKELDKIIKGLEKGKVYKGFLIEIPNPILSIFSKEGQQKFKQIYLENRIAGVEKNEALKLSSKLVSKVFYNQRVIILTGIEKALKKIVDRVSKAEFLGDEENIEEFPNREEIPIIEDDGDENIEKSCGEDHKEEKAEEGQKKMIFGRPFTFRGGKWVPDDEGKQKEPEGKEPKEEKPLFETAEEVDEHNKLMISNIIREGGKTRTEILENIEDHLDNMGVTTDTSNAIDNLLQRYQEEPGSSMRIGPHEALEGIKRILNQ